MRNAREQIAWVWSRLRRRCWSLAAFSLACWVVKAFLWVPLSAAALRLFLEKWGRCSVGNFEIVSFLLSAPGAAAVVVLGAIALAGVYLEEAGLMMLLAQADLSWAGAMRKLLGRFARLMALGVLQCLIALAVVGPFVAVAAGLLWAVWSGWDINGLIVLRPPRFWIGVGLAAPCLLAGVVAALRLAVRWILALPVLLFEPGHPATASMRSSRVRTNGKRWGIFWRAIAWTGLAAAISAGATVLFELAADWLLEHVGHSLAVVLPMTAAVLAAHAVAVGLISSLLSASLAGWVLCEYRATAGDHAPDEMATVVWDSIEIRPPSRRVLIAAGAAFAVFCGVTCWWLIEQAHVEETLEITAHRAGAATAPENTIAALRGAIDAGADWAEIDVQRTADGAVVVIHDSDLRRVAGQNRRVADCTLDELKKADVGRFFSPAFAGERIPTLDEFLAAAGDRIRLTIELKPNGERDVQPLAESVVEAIRRRQMIERCRICSQSYESLCLFRRLEPGLPVGYIAGAAIGDLARLDVDFLMVHTELATRELADEAAVHRIAVHAWTINDPDALVSLVDRGIANVITDNPTAIREKLDEIRGLSPTERILLRARNLLAD